MSKNNNCRCSSLECNTSITTTTKSLQANKNLNFCDAISQFVEPVIEEDSPKNTGKKNAEFKQQIHAALREFVDAFPHTKRNGVKRMGRKKKSARLEEYPER